MHTSNNFQLEQSDLERKARNMKNKAKRRMINKINQSKSDTKKEARNG